DEITVYFFVSEQSGIDNLNAEGKRDEQIYFVGNTMIDTLVAFDEAIAQSPIMEELSLPKGEPFVLVTMHRPANVDTVESLEKMIQLLAFTAERYRIILPLHPRTKNRLEQFGLWEEFSTLDRLTLTGPMDYLAFQKLISQSTFVLTDSGGIQEETTFRQVACITLRPNTERPSTIDLGTNELASFDLAELTQKIDRIAKGTYKQGQVPPLWDGKSTERIVAHLKNLL
ncbi:MAG: UDP-N-acetylglucosamine 2-epimerase, partial [Bacteroidota bacterium]